MHFLFSFCSRASPADAGSRVIIVCAVLVNKTQRVSGKHAQGNLIVPPGDVDTTVSTNGRVYVKYNDYEFYPLYFMHYQRAPEHLNESKYFRGNNSQGQNQQNNRAVQQQELQAQREREQARYQQQLREEAKRRELEQTRQNQKAQRNADHFRRLEREQELECSRQARAPIRQRENNSICLILWWLYFPPLVFYATVHNNWPFIIIFNFFFSTVYTKSHNFCSRFSYFHVHNIFIQAGIIVRRLFVLLNY